MANKQIIKERRLQDDAWKVVSLVDGEAPFDVCLPVGPLLFGGGTKGILTYGSNVWIYKQAIWRRAMRDQIYAHARSNRLGVEDAWLGLLVAKGVPREKAEKVLMLTISVIRGFAVRALWQQDEALFRSLLAEWKLIISGHLAALKKPA